MLELSLIFSYVLVPFDLVFLSYIGFYVSSCIRDALIRIAVLNGAQDNW
jgi:hypothetical protein